MRKKTTESKLTKALLTSLALLIAYLCKDLVLFFLKKVGYQKLDANPYLATLLGMGMVVLVFYPVYEWLKHLAKEWLGGYFSRSKKWTAAPLVGVILAFLLIFAILFWIYAYLWHGVNALSVFQ